MQDEVRDKSVALVIKVGKTGGRLTADLLKWAMRKYLAQPQNQKLHHGRQSVKQLVGQGAGVKSIDITAGNIKTFERAAKKYGVDFAVKKNPAKGEYYIFFKSRDDDAIRAAFADYTAKTMRRRALEKPSLLARLAHLKEASRRMEPDRAREQSKGELER